MKRNNVSKDYLLKKIFFEIGIPISFSKKIINHFFNILIEGLKKDGSVKLSGFGTFEVLSKKQRIGRNPKTKESKIITDRNVITFKPSKQFKSFINSYE